MSFKKLITEGIDTTKITVAEIFDFDGTTMDTLYPEIGKPIYKEKTGNDWAFTGWWGRADSLDMDVFDFKPIPEVKADYDKVANNEDSVKVLLTGRRPNLANHVKAVLDANDYKFDHYLFNYGNDTLTNKIEQINNLLVTYPNIRSINFWDDRKEHAPEFTKFFTNLVETGRIDRFNFVMVFNPQWTE
jgi:hypothetical protein